MRLIYLSPVPWASFAQRPHKFVEWFHRRTGQEVFWVEPYPARLPRLTDFRRIAPAQKEPPVTPPSWLKVMTPRALPLEPLPGSRWLNGWLWISLFRKLKMMNSGHSLLLVAGKPSVLALQAIEILKPEQSIYDAMDDFPAFHSGCARWSMARRELKLVLSVDYVLASSTVLKTHWSKIRAQKGGVSFVPNALDCSLLPSSRKLGVRSQPRVFGYVGTMGPWFDWAWIDALAKARPADLVRLIGPVFEPASFALPNNVELLPPCHHQAALKAMVDFDVGLIPFKRNELTESVDPIKYYEYKALGLPIISTDFGEMKFRAEEEGVFIADAQEVRILSERAIRYEYTNQAGVQFSKKNNWDARFDSIDFLRNKY